MRLRVVHHAAAAADSAEAGGICGAPAATVTAESSVVNKRSVHDDDEGEKEKGWGAQEEKDQDDDESEKKKKKKKKHTNARMSHLVRAALQMLCVCFTLAVLVVAVPSSRRKNHRHNHHHHDVANKNEGGPPEEAAAAAAAPPPPWIPQQPHDDIVINSNNNNTLRNIGIVSLYTSNIAEYAKPSAFLMREYCKRHGYAFFEMTERMSSSARSAPWDKLLAVAMHLDAVQDVVLWMDADVFITNPDVRMEDILGLSSTANSKQQRHTTHMWFSYDAGPWDFRYYTEEWLPRQGGDEFKRWDANMLPNTGVMAFRGEGKQQRKNDDSTTIISPSRRLLADAWDAPSDLYLKLDPQALTKDDDDPYRGWPWEQGGIWYALNTKEEHKRSSKMLPNRAMNSFPEQIYGTSDLAVHMVGMTKTRKTNFAWFSVGLWATPPLAKNTSYNRALCCVVTEEFEEDDKVDASPPPPLEEAVRTQEEEKRYVAECMKMSNSEEEQEEEEKKERVVDVVFVDDGRRPNAIMYEAALLRSFAARRGYGFRYHRHISTNDDTAADQSSNACIRDDDNENESEEDSSVLVSAALLRAAVDEMTSNAASGGASNIVLFAPGVTVADVTTSLLDELVDVPGEAAVAFTIPHELCDLENALASCATPVLLVRRREEAAILLQGHNAIPCEEDKNVVRLTASDGITVLRGSPAGAWPFFRKDNAPGGTFRPPLLSTAALPWTVGARLWRPHHAAACASDMMAGEGRGFDRLSLLNAATDGLRDMAVATRSNIVSANHQDGDEVAVWRADGFAAGMLALAYERRNPTLVSPEDDGGSGGAALTTWACELAQEGGQLAAAYLRASWALAMAGYASAQAEVGYLLLNGLVDENGSILVAPLPMATCAAHMPPSERHKALAESASAAAVSLAATMLT